MYICIYIKGFVYLSEKVCYYLYTVYDNRYKKNALHGTSEHYKNTAIFINQGKYMYSFDRYVHT